MLSSIQTGIGEFRGLFLGGKITIKAKLKKKKKTNQSGHQSLKANQFNLILENQPVIKMA